MTAADARRREWRQFRLLWRDATRRLLNTALLSRDGDPIGFAIWMLALVATPPALYALARGMNYAFLKRAPMEVLERAILGDRLFFIIYGMMVALLIGSIVWDALFPDRAEQEIVGVLPVRARTLAAARLAAALRLGAICALGITVPAGAVFTLFTASHPALRAMHTLAVGHVVGVMFGFLFVFLALLAFRGAMAVTVGTRAGNWIAIGLQVVALVALVDVFFFLPKVLDVLVAATETGTGGAAMPPLWFAFLISSVAADGFDGRPELAVMALAATALATAAVVTLYLATAEGVGRRLMEAQERHRPRRTATLATAVAHVVTRRPAIRSMFLFTVASLVRSRPHVLRLATYLSLALATVVFRVVTAGMHRPNRPGPRALDGAPERMQFAIERLLSDAPSAAQLSMPLIAIFFLVLGLLACFRVPTDAGANWPFRVRPPGGAAAATATWLALVVLGIFPVALGTSVGGLLLWPAMTALAAGAATFAAGLLLVELSLAEWRIVPFTFSCEPSTETVRWKWMVGLLALGLFGFGLAAIAAVALRSVTGFGIYMSALAVAIAAAHVRRVRAMRGRDMSFDEVVEETATLRLSEALS